MDASALFVPFDLSGRRLKSRIVMAPMTRYFSPGGVPTAEVAAYYRRRAEADVGLIISEGTGIDRVASLNHGPGLPRFYGEDALAGWAGVIEEVHAAGGRMAPQLWHVGNTGSYFPDWQPPAESEGPSGDFAPGKPLGRALSDEEIADTIAAFARGAADAKALGFDAVEFHAAHGYLIDQFFWEGSNRRTDAYGGQGLAERSRFAVEMLRAVRAAVGPAYPIIMRVSQWKQQDFQAKVAHTPDEMATWLGALAEAGADVFHCSQRRFWEPEFEGSDLNFAGWAKKLTGKTTITVGSVGLDSDFLNRQETTETASLDELIRRLERGDFDLVAVGRAVLQDPEWPIKVREGRMDQVAEYSRDAIKTLY